MPASNKTVFWVFTAILIVTGVLIALYFLQTRGCVTEIQSLSKNHSVRIVDKNKWQNFINVIGNCKDGRFTIYGTSTDGKTKLARLIRYSISDESQKNKVTNSAGDVLYTYSISYDAANQLATVILNFPNGTITDGNTVGGVFVLTSYKLFKGKLMTETDSSLSQFFNNLSGLGLIYENY